jgi:hypothetical protein
LWRKCFFVWIDTGKWYEENDVTYAENDVTYAENKLRCISMPWLWYCGVYSQNSEIYINIVKLCKTNITGNITCFPRTWRHKKFHFTVFFFKPQRLKCNVTCFPRKSKFRKIIKLVKNRLWRKIFFLIFFKVR